MDLIKNKKIILIISLILIITIIISTSYAFFISSDSQTNVASTACFELSFSASNTISLEHTYPISEAEASKLTPYTFTIKNICKEASSYNVTIEDLNSSDMDLSAIRYKLDNENSTILGSITPNQNKVLTNSKTSRTIASGILLYNEEVTYNLKLWIDENATKVQSAGKTFESKIIVVSSMNKEPYFEITVYPNNGNDSSVVQIVKGRSISSIISPAKVGYEFYKWCLDSELTNEIENNYIPLENSNIYAKFNANQYAISLDQQGATTNGSTSVTATYDSAMPSITLPSRIGYDFMGYFDQTLGNGIKYYSSDGTSAKTWDKTSDTTLYASWNVKTTSITLNNQSATASGTTSVTASYGSAIPTITVPSKSENTFGGYYTSPNGEGTKYINEDGTSARNWDKTDSSITLYAYWYYKVTFNARGGTSSISTKNYNTNANTIGTLPTVSRSGYTFVGWFEDANTGLPITTSYKVTSNKTLYARYKQNGVSYTNTWATPNNSYYTFNTPYDGVYQIQVYGAQGGNNGGRGGYAVGRLLLNQNTPLYLYVGGVGSATSTTAYSDYAYGGYGGGGSARSQPGYYTVRSLGSGGGSSDVRLTAGSWGDGTSIISRIIVAGGGGGAYISGEAGNSNSAGGSGGGLAGNSGANINGLGPGYGGHQTAGGAGGTASAISGVVGVAGSFGLGGTNTIHASCGGGGGYYGGGSSAHLEGAGGGSSYVSGLAGSVAVISSVSTAPRKNASGATCSYGTSDVVCSYHYSNYIFTNASTSANIQSGNGKIVITLVT